MVILSKGGITYQDCLDMTFEELFEEYVRLRECHGDIYNYATGLFEPLPVSGGS